MSASYYWLRFWTATAQTRPRFFMYRRHLMQLNNQYWGVCQQVLLMWDRNKQGLFIHVAAFAIFPTLFSNRNSLSQCTSYIPYKKPYNIAHFRSVSWHTQVCFQIKSNTILWTKGCFPCYGRYQDAIYRALVNYAEILGISWLRTITASYLACTIGNIFSYT